MLKLGNNTIGRVYLGSNSIGKAYLGSNLVFQKGSSPSPSGRLPDGYTELAYVRCGNSGSTAAVNTGVAGAKDLEITVRFEFGTFVNYGAIYGNYIDENHLCNRAILTNSSGSLYVAGGDNLATSVSGLRTYQTHTLTVTKTSATLEGATTAISASSKTDNTNNIWLGSNGSSTPQSTINLRIFAFSIKKDGTTILNYVPARRESDDKIGFYDIVADAFVPSSTSAEFIAGPDAVYSDGLLMCINWRGGQDLYSSNLWFDNVGAQYWTLSNGTQQSEYYEFINSDPASLSQYASLAGTLPDLGYHWKVVADIAIRTQASNPTSFVPIEFGTLGGVDSGSCSFSFLVAASSGRWDSNAKFNGSSLYPTFPSEKYNITPETITTSEVWIRRTVTIGVRASSTSGKDEAFINVSDMGSATSEEFTPMRFNKWMTGKNYIGRSNITPSSDYHFATSCRIYSINVYYEPII